MSLTAQVSRVVNQRWNFARDSSHWSFRLYLSKFFTFGGFAALEHPGLHFQMFDPLARISFICLYVCSPWLCKPCPLTVTKQFISNMVLFSLLQRYALVQRSLQYRPELKEPGSHGGYKHREAQYHFLNCTKRIVCQTLSAAMGSY